MKLDFESFKRIYIEEFYIFPPESIYKVYKSLEINKDGYIEDIDFENNESKYYELDEKHVKELYERLLDFFDNIQFRDYEIIGGTSKKISLEFDCFKIETEQEDDINGVMYQEIIDDFISKYAKECK